MKFVKGNKVRHPNKPEWGIGRVLENTDGDTVRVNFQRGGEKTLKLEFTNLVKIHKNSLPSVNIESDSARRSFLEEVNLLKAFVNDPESISDEDESYLTSYKDAILESLYQAYESIRTESAIEFSCSPHWLKFIPIDKLIYALKHEIEGNYSIEFTKLSWELLPSGEDIFSQIVSYFREIQRRDPDNNFHDFDEERIEKICSLHPDFAHKGLNELEGYVVFRFQGSPIAILECPKYGNAIYLIKRDWEVLSQLSKSELRKYHCPHDVEIIIHNGQWFPRLKRKVNRYLNRSPVPKRHGRT